MSAGPALMPSDTPDCVAEGALAALTEATTKATAYLLVRNAA